MQAVKQPASSATVTQTAPPVVQLVLQRKKKPEKKPEKKPRGEHIGWAEDVVEINEYSNKRKSKSQCRQANAHLM
jgi:hypothetical protein